MALILKNIINNSFRKLYDAFKHKTLSNLELGC